MGRKSLSLIPPLKKFTMNSATWGGHLKIILGPEREFEQINLQKFKSTAGCLDVEASD